LHALAPGQVAAQHGQALGIIGELADKVEMILLHQGRAWDGSLP
jgi:hypothetical protein